MDYQVIKSKRKTISLEIRNGQIIVRAPRFLSRSGIEAFVNSKSSWILKTTEKQALQMEKASKIKPLNQEEIAKLKEEAKVRLKEKVDLFANLLDVKYQKITVRKQKTRWGSCSGKGNLNFNCLLMLCPDFVIDYVVVHELCHLKQMNHSAKFWAEVEKILPQYKKAKIWLKENERLML